MRFPLGALSGRGGMTAAVVLSYNAKLWRAEQKRRPALQGNPPGTELDPVSIPVFRDWDTGADDRARVAAARRTAVGPAICYE